MYLAQIQPLRGCAGRAFYTTGFHPALFILNPVTGVSQAVSILNSHCLLPEIILGYKLIIECSTYEILQILSLSLLDKTPLNELLTDQN